MAPRGDWRPRDLKKALKWILSRKHSVEIAAKMSGISKATLYRAIQPIFGQAQKDQPNTKKKPGRKSIGIRTTKAVPGIMPIAEEVMVNEIIRLQNDNFVVSTKDIKKLCFYYCEDNPMYPNLQEFNFRNQMASEKWCIDFMMRHPEIKYVRRVRGRKPRMKASVQTFSFTNDDSTDSGITIGGNLENGQTSPSSANR